MQSRCNVLYFQTIPAGVVVQHMLKVVQHMCDSVRIKLSQLPTKLKLKLKLSLAIMNDSWAHPEVKMCPQILLVM